MDTTEGKIVRGKRNVYGQALGILIMDTNFPRIPGDIGNATTFRFPVVYRRVEGSKIDRVVREKDRSLLEPFIKAAQELEREGVRAITTTCGFLAMFQHDLAASVSIPLFSSSLIMVPLISRMLRPDQKVGILTADSDHLLEETHFRPLGWSSAEISVAIEGMQGRVHFTRAFPKEGETWNVDDVASEMRDAAQALLRREPSIGALVMECGNMAPFAHVVQQATGLPVFDVQTLANFVFESTNRRAYEGFL